MFWEEKIDVLKKQFAPTDFKVPFIDAHEIMKNIENRFIVKTNSNQNFNNWESSIKQKQKLTSINSNQLESFVSHLDNASSYWTVIVLGNDESAKHFVYDCKPNSLKALTALQPLDFFLADKKYLWFTFFKRNNQENTIEIYKSGKALTPFEN
jgi:hypothetical protein